MSSKKPFELFGVFLEANEAAKKKTGLLDRALNELVKSERAAPVRSSETSNTPKVLASRKAAA